MDIYTEVKRKKKKPNIYTDNTEMDAVGIHKEEGY